MDFAPVCAAWTGGAIFGALEGLPDYSALDVLIYGGVNIENVGKGEGMVGNIGQMEVFTLQKQSFGPRALPDLLTREGSGWIGSLLILTH